MMNVSGRTLCYSGSDLYQKLTVDCNAQDPTYTGQWYCATIEVCEQYISENRQCMTTKGCAKADQCTVPTSTNVYEGNSVKNSADKLFAGMTIKPTCCLNSNYNSDKNGFADDDGALDYGIICNSAGKSMAFSASMILAITVGATIGLL